jgi:hypothetical protein
LSVEAIINFIVERSGTFDNLQAALAKLNDNDLKFQDLQNKLNQEIQQKSILETYVNTLRKQLEDEQRMFDIFAKL